MSQTTTSAEIMANEPGPAIDQSDGMRWRGSSPLLFTPAALLAACGGGSQEGNSQTATVLASTPEIVDPPVVVDPVEPPEVVVSASSPTAVQAARFLLQAQFHATNNEIASVQTLGFEAWLEARLNAAPSSTTCSWLDSRGYTTMDEATIFNDGYPADYAIWRDLIVAPDGVRRRMALALSEIFVVSLSGFDFDWQTYGACHYWDLLCANALGNFRKLLGDVTLSPAMGVYLNMKGSLKEDPSTGRAPDENYAREVMQLFTIGLYELNQDGTYKLDGNGKPVDCYDAAEVSALARVFTGWNVDRSGGTITDSFTGRTILKPESVQRPMVLNPVNHSNQPASFLGTTVPANTPGARALEIALDTLFNHPNVGPFIGKQLIQRFVTGNPSPAYVSRVAAKFNDNGLGVRGDLKAVLRAVLLDPEARSDAVLSQPGFGKLREPMIRLVQWARTFGVRSAAGSWKIPDLSNTTRLSQSPLRSGSVFNFFRPGYVPPGTALAAGKVPAPEFQIVNETTVASYLNHMQGIVRDGIAVQAPESRYQNFVSPNVRDMVPSYTTELQLVTNAPALVDRLNLLMCAGQLSAFSRNTIVSALNADPVTETSAAALKLNRVATAVLLVMASPEYLVQK